MLRFLLAGLLPIALPLPVHAADTTRLFTHKYWYVDHVVFDDGSQACNAGSNGERQSLSLWADPEGTITFHASDSRWALATRENVPVIVDIDYDRFNGTARTEGTSVFVVGVSVEFVEQMMDGKAIALLNADGRRLISFSLSGSKAALLKWVECFGLISGSRGSDPFASGYEDPF